MSTDALLEELRAANPVPQEQLAEIDDVALLRTIDEKYAALPTNTNGTRPTRSPDIELQWEFLRAPDKGSAAPLRRRLTVAVVAVAATIVVVAGIGAMTREDNAVVTDPSVSNDGTDPTPSADEPALAATVFDPVSSYQWTRLPHDEVAWGGVAAKTGPEGPWAVTAGGPGLVAVGSTGSLYNEDAAVWTSVDGLTWTRVPHDEAVFGLGAAGQTLMTSVVDTGSGLVAVGQRNTCCGPNLTAAVWNSVDGRTWSRVPHDGAVFGGATGMSSVTTGGPGLVAVGNHRKSDQESDGVIWNSVDGHTWTRVPHDQALFDQSSLAGVISGGPGLVAVGSVDLGAAVWTSEDGHTWSRVPHDEAIFGNADISDVTPGGPGLVAVGSDDLGAAVWTSEDGISWSRVPHDEAVFGNAGMDDVATGGPGLVAIGNLWRSDEDAASVVWTSEDGITWSRVPHDEAVFGGGVHMSSVAAGGPGLVVVGLADPDDGVVWVGTPAKRQANDPIGEQS